MNAWQSWSEHRVLKGINCLPKLWWIWAFHNVQLSCGLGPFVVSTSYNNRFDILCNELVLELVLFRLPCLCYVIIVKLPLYLLVLQQSYRALLTRDTLFDIFHNFIDCIRLNIILANIIIRLRLLKVIKLGFVFIGVRVLKDFLIWSRIKLFYRTHTQEDLIKVVFTTV